jgi:hypothetical protein
MVRIFFGHSSVQIPVPGTTELSGTVEPNGNGCLIRVHAGTIGRPEELRFIQVVWSVVFFLTLAFLCGPSLIRHWLTSLLVLALVVAAFTAFKLWAGHRPPWSQQQYLIRFLEDLFKDVRTDSSNMGGPT